MSETQPPDGAVSAISSEDKGSVRVAIEGCAHGTLHAIYASIDEACQVKGWDGVDLVIIGGDFQAVRNQHDLNVTSMPQKYRRMADFHEYYSGARTAPYLTIFIGGNHEASNHLFELYYGGWVAPNIYYLGAANVVRFGPLRIAGLSGIWKGYDYPKPHFERLPYNREDTSSIYHVRELDVRKLLSIRSQVDIGLSHDWPQGIEMHGDYEWLFKAKKGFGVDSQSGKLGNPAARECLDWLRPPYWFSAHLHTRYAAILQHDQTGGSSSRKSTSNLRSHNSPDQHTAKKAKAGHLSNPSSVSSSLSRTHDALPTPEARQRVSAWQQFHVSAQRDDAEERDKILQDKESRRREEERTGIRSTPQYSFQETFKQVGSDAGSDRQLISTTQSEVKPENRGNAIPNLDGCFFSRPVKRQRLDSASQGLAPGQKSSGPALVYARDQLDGAQASLPEAPDAVVENPDAIDIDMSDEDELVATGRNSTTTSQATPLPIPEAKLHSGADQDTAGKRGLFSVSTSEESEDGGVKLNAHAAAFLAELSIPTPASRSPESPELLPGAPNSTLNPSAETFPPPISESAGDSTMEDSTQLPVTAAPNPEPQPSENEVSEEMRAQLAALSSTFTQKEKEKIEVSPSLPFPTEISNKTTEFLALGKCEAYQEFLQLLEIRSTTSHEQKIVGPLKLSYDPEWLAIQRVFASELALGGLPTDRVPPHRGEAHYRDQIVKEQEWIFEHVVRPGKLLVPENFSITAPVYDPNLNVEPTAMPTEVTNPQTSAYCELIGIENKFDISEGERNFRKSQGPRPDRPEYLAYESRFSRRQSGGHGHGHGGARGRGGGGGGGGRGHGHGGRGGGGGGGGGRGRGRGRGGRW
ncbi:hypothetical protein A1O3_00921 [Capronia epimyces CBS 606.96]|uniref:Lariat debranching enzyme C-terminal domain-containing protein n=1 Tax=Capronia epimyces CBS 606.96 TaxID=1182542 RepID=W9YT09_9EURO|nr:uncharacterized protein A1O3_00921 [Capronia epimyces CBS 606.96]EXJ92371.1 hypothetical protein A1O3_00921 [Capronia epimyces CBS 606.96]